MAYNNAFKPGSNEQNKWLSTIQSDDIVPYGMTVDGFIAGANLPTSDRDTYKNMKFVVMYAVPLHIMRALVYQHEITSDVFTRAPFFSLPYPRGQSNKYSSQTCKTDTQTTVCTQQYVSIFKHTFDFLKGTQGLRGNFPINYEGSFFVLFMPYEAGKPLMCKNNLNPMKMFNQNNGVNKENILGLTVTSQDFIIIFLLLGIIIAIFQNQRLHEKIQKNN